MNEESICPVILYSGEELAVNDHQIPVPQYEV